MRRYAEMLPKRLPPNAPCNTPETYPEHMKKLAALAALPLALAACSGGSSDSASPPPSTTSSATPSSTAAHSPDVASSAPTSSMVSSPNESPTSTEVGEVPAPLNPVDLLKKIKGCQFEAGASQGEIDMQGSRYASCRTADEYEFTARTNVMRPQPMGSEHATDSKLLIYGDTWYVWGGNVYGDNLKPGDAEKYAKMLGGKVAKSDADLTQ